MMLDFPVLSDSALLLVDSLTIYATHGHHEFPSLEEGNVIISGHTHIPVDYVKDGIRYINPGSVSIPKENSEKSYIVYENREFVFYSLDGAVYDSVCF